MSFVEALDSRSYLTENTMTMFHNRHEILASAVKNLKRKIRIKVPTIAVRYASIKEVNLNSRPSDPRGNFCTWPVLDKFRLFHLSNLFIDRRKGTTATGPSHSTKKHTPSL